MEAKDLTSQQRIMILEDVLQKLESGDEKGGLCLKITDSTLELFDIWEIQSKNIIPILTLENARKVTEVKDRVHKEFYWWNYFGNYDFENRIKFVKWMITENMPNIDKCTDANTALAEVFLRPKTRGKLYDALKKGIKCECVTSNVEFTSSALESLNAMGCGNVKFKTYPSKNEGWSIYESVV